jgi:hypothetical protein
MIFCFWGERLHKEVFMRVVTVESTTLATVAYDEASKVLQLEFWSRAVYLYFDVPTAVHPALLAAPSMGRYF